MYLKQIKGQTDFSSQTISIYIFKLGLDCVYEQKIIDLLSKESTVIENPE